MRLETTDISVDLSGARVVRNASLSVGEGEVVVLIGPNGAGKTSLMRACLGLIPVSAGGIFLDGRPLTEISTEARAQFLAYLPQNRSVAWPLRVADVVALGRYAFGQRTGRLSDTDRQAVKEALQSCDLTHLADRAIPTLSGGEAARVHCARAVVTGAPFLFADEPVAALDPRHQLAIMGLLTRYAGTGKAVVVSLHDVGLAARFATRVVMMHQGRVLADGAPRDVITPEQMRAVYGVDVEWGARGPVVTGMA